MKKVVALFLALSMVFALCGCGKSEDAQAVDDLILSIGNVSIDSNEAIATAEEAYNALTAEQKKEVENYDKLEAAADELYKLRLRALIDDITLFNAASEDVCLYVSTAWDNVGSDKVLLMLQTAALFNLKDKTVAEYVNIFSLATGKEVSEKDVLQLLAAAAQAFNPGALEWFNDIPTTKWVSEEEQLKTLRICEKYNEQVKYVKENGDLLTAAVKEFRDIYGQTHKDEVDTLNKWMIDSNLFADLALDPSGTLFSYNSSIEEYTTSMNKYKRTMESFC